ncbi:peptide deformylase [Canibacter zhoujuaniae]|uniref:peptide deformylase n=1 Tax=Canibacter zhoujuaniae TaxID=2708343 RepID=UPI001424A78A|nr:peptide deformylase [Canibacter zhoujuaniae]
MAILPITICGEPVLHTPASPVTEFDAALRKLVDDMYETTVAAPGVGLAAPQVGIGKRIFVWDYADQDVAPAQGVAINPVLLISPPQPGDPDQELEVEGCLSFPGERFALRRAERALLTAQDIDGREFQIDATGWFARIMQHEYDHLNGYLYIDRLGDFDYREAMRIKRKRKWGKPGLTWLPGQDNLEG